MYTLAFALQLRKKLWVEDVASVFSLDDGDGSFSETSGNASIAPQKTVLVVSSEFLKCSICIINARIVNRHYGKSPRTDPVLFLLWVRTSTSAAIWKGSCEGLVTRCTWRLCVVLSPTGISAAKCDVLQLLQYRQQ